MTTNDLEARQKILDVARSLFAVKGFDGVSVRDITSEAHVNLSLVSYHFGGKEGLYRAVVTEHVTHVKGIVESVLAEFDKEMTKESFIAEMEKILTEVVSFKLSIPELHMIMMRETSNGFPYLKDVCDSMFEPIAQKIVGIFEQAKKNKIIRQDINCWVHFLSLVHASDMYLLMMRVNPDLGKACFKMPEQKDKYIRQLIIVFVEGIIA